MNNSMPSDVTSYIPILVIMQYVFGIDVALSNFLTILKQEEKYLTEIGRL